jgi:hypothetical protein
MLALRNSTTSLWSYDDMKIVPSLTRKRHPPTFSITVMDPPKHTPRQTSYKEIPIEDWDENHLIGWIQEKKPRLLHDGDIEKLRNERVTGLVFLRRGCDKFFRECGLALGMAAQLTLLLEELAEEDGNLHAIHTA